MKIEFGGDFTVARTPDEVYKFLVDPERFCPLLPDFQSMTKQDDKNFSVNLRVGISHIRGNAVVRMTLAEETPPNHAVYDGKGDVPSGTVTLRAGFDLEPDGAGTKVKWKGESQIAGRLPSIAGGLLQPLAKKSIQKLIDALQKALAQPGAPATAQPGAPAAAPQPAAAPAAAAAAPTESGKAGA